MSWLFRIASRIQDGTKVRYYTRPTKGKNHTVFTPRSQRGVVKHYDPSKKRYVVDNNGAKEEVHPKNIARIK